MWEESGELFTFQWDGVRIEWKPLSKLTGDGRQYSRSHSFQKSMLEMIVRLRWRWSHGGTSLQDEGHLKVMLLHSIDCHPAVPFKPLGNRGLKW